MTFGKPFCHPTNVIIDPAFPSILESSYLITIIPNYFIVAIGEERGVEIYQINAVFGEMAENFFAIPAINRIRLVAHIFFG
ncbi:MAG: hypothetical protein ACREAN_01005 [Nitrosopumilaceae archaeon]